jgi:S1-C subfamily serine protease
VKTIVTSALVLVIALAAFLPAQEAANNAIPKRLQEVSVTIRTDRAEGSGVVAVTKDKTCWVLTAAHVVDDLRTVREITDPKTGAKRSLIEFRDATVIEHLVEDGRTVGRLELDAEVVRFSAGHDLALLKVRKKGMAVVGCEFYLADALPPVGADFFHVGSLLGQLGSGSLTSGILSKHGRVLNGYTYDQTSCPSFPGSSGGGVFFKHDGKYVGMITRGAGETFSLMVPIRRIRAWAKATGIEFVLDPKLDSISINDRPIEDNLKE